MRWTKLNNLWNNIQGSFWFIPSFMIVSAFCMSIITIQIDREFEIDLLTQSLYVANDSILSSFIHVSPEGARAVLTVIAGSMMTVAGVTFSVTIVALTLASSQFGPRLLRNFTEDKKIQFVLGAFNSTFIFCLLILRSVKATHNDTFVPVLSVNLAVVLAIFNVAILIFFIHHIAISIKAEHVVSSVYSSLLANIDRIFKEVRPVNGKGDGDKTVRAKCDNKYTKEYSLEAGKDGYIQAIDYGELVSLASQNNFKIKLSVRAGKFAASTSNVAKINSDKELKDSLKEEILGCFIFGRQRTPEQDVEYAIHQMVEVAVRSLSPGINDPFTAITCIDYLGAAICYISKRQLPDSHCLDDDGKLRVVATAIRFGDILDTAFNQIRQHSKTNVAVIIRLMEAYATIADSSVEKSQNKELLRHADMLKKSAEINLSEEHDVEDLIDRYDKLLSMLGKT